MARTTTKRPKAKAPTAKSLDRQRRKTERKKDRRQRRREWLRSRAHRNRHHGLPLSIDLASLATGSVAHYGSPTAGLITGAASAAVIGIPAALGALSDRERRAVTTHGLGGAAWSLAAGVFGPASPLVAAVGALGAITAQFGWVESRRVRTTVSSSKVDKRRASEWNDEGGVLDRAGLGGATMFASESIWSADGQRQVGMIYHLDLAGSGVQATQALTLGSKIEAEFPSRLRRGAVTMAADEDDANHVMVQVMWRKPWSLDTKLNHPIAEHLDEIRELVNSAIEHQASGGQAAGPVEIPGHVKHLLPNMSTIKNPFPAGELPDGSPHYKAFWRKGYGAIHGLKIGFTGSGKTVDINSEIASLLPCRDVLIWVLDVSIKRGKDFEAWGPCIDWMATTIKEAKAMLKQAIAFADGRGKEYRKSSILSPSMAPSIVLFIDELSALWKQEPELCASVLGRATKEFRSQNLILRTASQRGSQDDFGIGFAGVRQMLAYNELLRVKTEGEADFTLSDTSNLPGDPRKYVYGEAVEEDSITGAQVHRKGYFLDIGDDEDEDDQGIIPEIVSVYAPFRPVLDERTMKYADKAYRNRTRPAGAGNPLLTPEAVAEKRTPAPIGTDDDLADHVARITTNTQWLESFMNGEFRINTYEPTSEGDDMDTSTPVMDLADLTEHMGISTGDDELVREQRAETMRERLSQSSARTGAAIAELDAKLAQVSEEESALSMAEAFGQVEVKTFPDDDPLKVFCLKALGKASTQGISTGQIAARYAKTTDGNGKRPSTTTVMARLKDLHAAGKARPAGAGRAVRWYRADQAPDTAQ